MIHLLFCLFLLVPLVLLPLLGFAVSFAVGVIATLVSLVLMVPLLLATYAHIDLLRVKSRFRLTEEEVDEFSSLVPVLATKPEFARLPRREMRQRTKRAAADIILQRRAGA